MLLRILSKATEYISINRLLLSTSKKTAGAELNFRIFLKEGYGPSASDVPFYWKKITPSKNLDHI